MTRFFNAVLQTQVNLSGQLFNFFLQSYPNLVGRSASCLFSVIVAVGVSAVCCWPPNASVFGVWPIRQTIIMQEKVLSLNTTNKIAYVIGKQLATLL